MGLSNSHHSVSDHQLLPKNIAAMPRYIASSISTNSSSSKVWLSFSSNTPVFLRVTWSKKETAQRAHRLVSHQFSMIAFKTCGVVFFRHRTLTMTVNANDDNNKFGHYIDSFMFGFPASHISFLEGSSKCSPFITSWNYRKACHWKRGPGGHPKTMENPPEN